MDLAEASEDEVLQKLTADPSSTDHQDARLVENPVSSEVEATASRLTCLMREYRAPKDCLRNRSRPMV